MAAFARLFMNDPTAARVALLIAAAFGTPGAPADGVGTGGAPGVNAKPGKVPGEVSVGAVRKYEPPPGGKGAEVTVKVGPAVRSGPYGTTAAVAAAIETAGAEELLYRRVGSVHAEERHGRIPPREVREKRMW